MRLMKNGMIIKMRFLMGSYVLKWKDLSVLCFNTEVESLTVLNRTLLPIGLTNMNESYDMIKRFCSDRVLVSNRRYYKEILTSCGIDDQNAISICLVSKGISFRDNYWIDTVDSKNSWSSVNLYQNEFSNKIAKVGITGESDYVNIGDKIFTGELTNKGTRAKCYYRYNKDLFLFKHETDREIDMELVSHSIADAIGIPSSTYFVSELFGKKCSVCQILTNESYELIPYRDFIEAYGNNAINEICRIDYRNFLLMIIFDYITLNTDRNRDNFGILRYNGNLVSLYPLYDHDSCFKGKSTNAIYFPLGMTFSKSLEWIKSSPMYANLGVQIIKSNLKSNDLRSILLSYLDDSEYENMLSRVNNL